MKTGMGHLLRTLIFAMVFSAALPAAVPARAAAARTAKDAAGKSMTEKSAAAKGAAGKDTVAESTARKSTETKSTAEKSTATKSTAGKSASKKDGWVKESGGTYYYSKGKKVTGWQTIDGGKYYFFKSGEKKGRMATGLQKIGANTYFFTKSGSKKGRMVTGWKTIEKKRYYFDSAGRMAVGWKIFGKICYYFKKGGALDPKKTVSSSRAGDSTGTAKEKTLRRAKAIAAQITAEKMTKEQKLRVCFEYVMKTYTGRRPRTPHYYGVDWPVVYANDMFLDGSGNCFSYAAAFAFLARACGYTNVYACNDTGHGWAEIDGRIYDPEEYRNTEYKYYGASYSEVPVYRRGISAGSPFMHVKI